MTTKVGVGFSQLTDAREAACQAARQALAGIQGQEPRLVVLFGTVDLEMEYALDGACSVLGNVPLIGGCSKGVIAPGGAFDSGVAVMVLGSDEMQIVTDVALNYSQDPQRAAREAMQRIRQQAGEAYHSSHGLLLVVADSQVSSEALVTAVQMLGDEKSPLTQIVGGGGQDPSGRTRRPVFSGDRMYGDALATALILTPGPVGVGVRHGYRPLGHPLLVTQAEGNVLYRLNGRSAFEAYLDQFPDRPELTLENFGRFALDHPLGLPLMGREYIIRDSYRAGPAGELMCGGMIPTRAIVQIMDGSKQTLIGSARASAREAVQALGDQHPLLALVFSCVSRLEYLGPAAQREVAAIQEEIGQETPLIGLFSFGEIAAQPDSAPNMHNKTAVIGVLGGA